MLMLGAGVLAAAAPVPGGDRTLVLDQRAGNYRYLAAFRGPGRSGYADAIDAFGSPSSYSVRWSQLCLVRWNAVGAAVKFIGRPGRPCSAGRLFEAAWYGMTLYGRGWHTRGGLQIGQPYGGVRRLYPRAKFETVNGRRWLVLARRRQDEFNFVILAVRFNRAGRVAAIEVPAAYVF
jgi:hypothetical protein